MGIWRRTRAREWLVAAATVIVAALVGPPAASARSCHSADVDPLVASSDVVEHATLCLVNLERHDRDRRRLRPHPDLREAALRHTRDMLASGLFSHRGSDGSQPWDRIRRAGYTKGADRWFVGENLSYGYAGRATPRDVVESWMDSPEHKKNLLHRRFREAGVVEMRGTPEFKLGSRVAGATYTMTFGSRR